MSLPRNHRTLDRYVLMILKILSTKTKPILHIAQFHKFPYHLQTMAALKISLMLLHLLMVRGSHNFYHSIWLMLISWIQLPLLWEQRINQKLVLSSQLVWMVIIKESEIHHQRATKINTKIYKTSHLSDLLNYMIKKW